MHCQRFFQVVEIFHDFSDGWRRFVSMNDQRLLVILTDLRGPFDEDLLSSTSCRRFSRGSSYSHLKNNSNRAKITKEKDEYSKKDKKQGKRTETSPIGDRHISPEL